MLESSSTAFAVTLHRVPIPPFCTATNHFIGSFELLDPTNVAATSLKPLGLNPEANSYSILGSKAVWFVGLVPLVQGTPEGRSFGLDPPQPNASTIEPRTIHKGSRDLFNEFSSWSKRSLDLVSPRSRDRLGWFVVRHLPRRD